MSRLFKDRLVRGVWGLMIALALSAYVWSYTSSTRVVPHPNGTTYRLIDSTFQFNVWRPLLVMENAMFGTVPAIESSRRIIALHAVTS